MKRALITGITGQDGAYLAEFLLEEGYELHATSQESPEDFVVVTRSPRLRRIKWLIVES